MSVKTKFAPKSKGTQRGVVREEAMDHIDVARLKEVFQVRPNGNREGAAQKAAAIQEAVRNLLLNMGEDPDRQGLRRTPERVADMLDELTAGYHVDLVELTKDALFDVDYGEMVVVKDIDYYSLCEHHLLPFFGKAHVAYLPNGRAVGLSRIPRIVEMFARRLQVQERMTQQIADFIHELVQPGGVAVVVEGTHLCTTMRGVKSSHAALITGAALGAFKTDPQMRAEFMKHIGRRDIED